MSQKAEEPMQAPEDDRLDILLKEHFHAAEVQLTPSLGFLHEVMSGVTQDAAAPERIPFPWRRALAGLACIGAVLCGWAAYLARHVAHMTEPVSPLQSFFAWNPLGAGVVYAGSAMLLSLGIMVITLRWMGEST